MTRLLLATLLAAGFTAAHAESATYLIEPTHTFVYFEAAHFKTSTLRGRFEKKEGTVTIDKAAKTGKADITIDASVVSTGVPQLDTHLKSKDFFNVAEYPTVTFTADKFNFDGDKLNDVSGMLTLMGKTQPVTLKATNFNCYMSPMLKREVCGGDFETTITRSQYGMNYGLPGIPDNIRLLIQIEAVKQQ